MTTINLRNFFQGIGLFFLLAYLACQAPATPEVASSNLPQAISRPEVDTSLFETFEYTDGDTTYLMKKYYMVFLKNGPNRNQDEGTAARIQEEHLAHMARLADEKKIVSAGPFDDDGDIRGIVIYSVSSLEEAKELTSQDPAVIAGRLVVEVHPWWAAVGTMLY